MVLTKKQHGEHWRHLFRGDPDGARCMQPPYTLSGESIEQLLRWSEHSSCSMNRPPCTPAHARPCRVWLLQG